jgi:predicted  nucleic acid-binding Zn-ribbon protein
MGEIEKLKKINETLEDEITNLKTEVKNLEDVITELEDEKDELEDEKDELEDEKDELEKIKTKLENEVYDLRLSDDGSFHSQLRRDFFHEYSHLYTPWELEFLLINGKKFLNENIGNF